MYLSTVLQLRCTSLATLLGYCKIHENFIIYKFVMFSLQYFLLVRIDFVPELVAKKMKEKKEWKISLTWRCNCWVQNIHISSHWVLLHETTIWLRKMSCLLLMHLLVKPGFWHVLLNLSACFWLFTCALELFFLEELFVCLWEFSIMHFTC